LSRKSRILNPPLDPYPVGQKNYAVSRKSN